MPPKVEITTQKCGQKFGARPVELEVINMADVNKHLVDGTRAINSCDAYQFLPHM